jgi:hypothetical protein
MTAFVPAVSTTESLAPNSTLAVVSGRIDTVLTLPTSTPAIRTKLPFAKPDTLVKSAL